MRKGQPDATPSLVIGGHAVFPGLYYCFATLQVFGKFCFRNDLYFVYLLSEEQNVITCNLNIPVCTQRIPSSIQNVTSVALFFARRGRMMSGPCVSKASTDKYRRLSVGLARAVIDPSVGCSHSFSITPSLPLSTALSLAQSLYFPFHLGASKKYRK